MAISWRAHRCARSRRCTLLVVAAVSGETSLVQLLLRHGADPNVMDMDTNGNSALSMAAVSSKSEDEASDIVQALLAAGASVNLQTDFRAAKHQKREEVAKLLEKGFLLQHGVPVCDH